jgi:Flp pilus assembly protein TadD
MLAKSEQRWAFAADLIGQVLDSHTDWEHGYGFFHLAECFEELGRFAEARNAYQLAVKTSPGDPTLLGGLASFLYQHGPSREALASYLDLLRLERTIGIDEATTMLAVRSLGQAVGLSDEEIEVMVS